MSARDRGTAPVWPLIAVVLLAAGCARGAPPRWAATDVAHLRWIEGTWRGSGDVETPFYERYRFENDSTLVENGLDSTLSAVQDTARFELRDGRFGNAHWRATVLTPDSAVFVAAADPARSFRWRRAARNAWTAVIGVPAQNGKPARVRIYHMERWPQ